MNQILPVIEFDMISSISCGARCRLPGRGDQRKRAISSKASRGKRLVVDGAMCAGRGLGGASRVSIPVQCSCHTIAIGRIGSSAVRNMPFQDLLRGALDRAGRVVKEQLLTKVLLSPKAFKLAISIASLSV